MNETVVISDIISTKFGIFTDHRPVVIVPGGPWISGAYLDTFAEEVSLATETTVYRFILPNHESDRSNTSAGIQFSEFFRRLQNSVSEIHSLHGRSPIFVGHSFGAFVLAKLLLECPKRQGAGAILFSPPLVLGFSPGLRQQLAEDGIIAPRQFTSEADFMDWWAKVRPYYFYKANRSVGGANSKLQETFFQGNEAFTDGAPNPIDTFQKLTVALKQGQLNASIIAGEDDPIGLNNNTIELQKIFGDKLLIIDQCGHFPMLEAKNTVTNKAIKLIESLSK